VDKDLVRVAPYEPRPIDEWALGLHILVHQTLFRSFLDALSMCISQRLSEPDTRHGLGLLHGLLGHSLLTWCFSFG
jgi:hypothetical protein